jgi:putative ABC transport system substrate-binding protein
VEHCKGHVANVTLTVLHHLHVDAKRVRKLSRQELRLPVVSAIRSFVDEGGLLAYGVNLVSLFHRAGSHVDRILHRQKPADIPVEQPTKFEMVINLKTATTLGLTVPTNLLVSADEVIE